MLLSLAYYLHMYRDTLGIWVSCNPSSLTEPLLESIDISLFMSGRRRYQAVHNFHRGVCQPYQTQLFPAKSDTYASTKKVISHQLKAATTEFAIRYCRPLSIPPAALTMWYNEVSRRLSMMIIMAVSVFFSQDKVTKQGAVILRKSTLYDSGVSIGRKEFGEEGFSRDWRALL